MTTPIHVQEQLQLVRGADDPLELADTLNALVRLLPATGLTLSDVLGSEPLTMWYPNCLGDARHLDGVLSCGVVEFDYVVMMRAAEPTRDAWSRPVEAGDFYLLTPETALAEAQLNAAEVTP